MKKGIVVSKTKRHYDSISESLGGRYILDFSTSSAPLTDSETPPSCDILFIDVNLLATRETSKNHVFESGISKLKKAIPSIQIIVMSTPEDIRKAVNAVKAGADNYITYPVNSDELLYVVENLTDEFRVQSELDYLRSEQFEFDLPEVSISNSPQMKKVLENVKLVAPTVSTVLLLGETGTGKGVTARMIHRLSKRKNKQFISIHCGEISDTLLESELFGHEKGSFTGASKKKLGKFEIAHQGTIFLDEIGAISPSMQIKLLRVIQDRIIERVGGEESIDVDIRIIAATNADLEEMSRRGEFRKDLFYRLNVFPITLPPLRDRIEDLPLLIETFIRNLNKYYNKKIKGIDDDVIKALKTYDWPGNIRELENLIERAYILETSNYLSMESFSLEIGQDASSFIADSIDTELPLEKARKIVIEDFEKMYLKEVLKQKKGIIKDAAAAAGIGPRQLHKLLLKYGIRKEEYRRPESDL